MKYIVPIIVSLVCVTSVDIHAGNKRTEKAKRQKERKRLEKEQSTQLTDLGHQNDNDTGEPSESRLAPTSPRTTPVITTGGRSTLQSPRDTPTSPAASIAVIQAQSVVNDGGAAQSPAEQSPATIAAQIVATANLQSPGDTNSDRAINRASLDIQRAVEGDGDDGFKSLDLNSEHTKRGCCKCTIL